MTVMPNSSDAWCERMCKATGTQTSETGLEFEADIGVICGRSQRVLALRSPPFGRCSNFLAPGRRLASGSSPSWFLWALVWVGNLPDESLMPRMFGQEIRTRVSLLQRCLLPLPSLFDPLPPGIFIVCLPTIYDLETFHPPIHAPLTSILSPAHLSQPLRCREPWTLRTQSQARLAIKPRAQADQRQAVLTRPLPPVSIHHSLSKGRSLSVFRRSLATSRTAPFDQSLLQPVVRSKRTPIACTECRRRQVKASCHRCCLQARSDTVRRL